MVNLELISRLDDWAPVHLKPSAVSLWMKSVIRKCLLVYCRFIHLENKGCTILGSDSTLSQYHMKSCPVLEASCHAVTLFMLSKLSRCHAVVDRLEQMSQPHISDIS